MVSKENVAPNHPLGLFLWLSPHIGTTLAILSQFGPRHWERGGPRGDSRQVVPFNVGEMGEGVVMEAGCESLHG